MQRKILTAVFDMQITTESQKALNSDLLNSRSTQTPLFIYSFPVLLNPSGSEGRSLSQQSLVRGGVTLLESI